MPRLPGPSARRNVSPPLSRRRRPPRRARQSTKRPLPRSACANAHAGDVAAACVRSRSSRRRGLGAGHPHGGGSALGAGRPRRSRRDLRWPARPRRPRADRTYREGGSGAGGATQRVPASGAVLGAGARSRCAARRWTKHCRRSRSSSTTASAPGCRGCAWCTAKAPAKCATPYVEMLAKHPLVKGFEFAEPRDGGEGVTVVEMAQ